MRPITATLAKLRTDDGLWEFWEGIAIGKEYLVYLDSLQVVGHFNRYVPGLHHTTMLQEVHTGDWLPIECLNIPEKEKLFQ